jgi:hypothetical protein
MGRAAAISRGARFLGRAGGVSAKIPKEKQRRVSESLPMEPSDLLVGDELSHRVSQHWSPTPIGSDFGASWHIARMS